MLVIQGAGRTFCAGDDITEMGQWGDANEIVRRACAVGYAGGGRRYHAGMGRHHAWAVPDADRSSGIVSFVTNGERWQQRRSLARDFWTEAAS